MRSRSSSQRRSRPGTIGLTADSRGYFVASSDVAVVMATTQTDGVRWFPGATPTGGEVIGVYREWKYVTIGIGTDKAQRQQWDGR